MSNLNFVKTHWKGLADMVSRHPDVDLRYYAGVVEGHIHLVLATRALLGKQSDRERVERWVDQWCSSRYLTRADGAVFPHPEFLNAIGQAMGYQELQCES